MKITNFTTCSIIVLLNSMGALSTPSRCRLRPKSRSQKDQVISQDNLKQLNVSPTSKISVPLFKSEDNLLSMNVPSTSKLSVNVTFDTIIGKHMVGYQGWFRCENGIGSTHWGSNHPVVDMLPDVSEYDPEGLCILKGFKYRDGTPVKVFTSESPSIVDTHFKWMKDYGIHGAFVQDFLSDMKSKRGIQWRVNVTGNVKNAAEKHERAWAIMFDISGFEKNTLGKLKEILPYFEDMIKGSPMYLHENGRPLIAVWGFNGNPDKHISDPKVASDIISFLKSKGYSIYGGFVKSTKGNFVKPNEWKDIIYSLDVVSPWNVGSEATYEIQKERAMKDLKMLKESKVIYSPVIFPGFSWKNLHQNDKVVRKLNQIPRQGGKFYGDLANAMIDAGAKTIYTAMFDEVNEGTAIFKTVANSSQLPPNSPFVFQDTDGYDMPSDHYLKLAGEFSRKLQTQT